MFQRKILQEDREYTFRSYFELPYEADEILSEFGYTLVLERLSLPQTKTENLSSKIDKLQQNLEEILPLISLSSETARRETLVSPILLEVIRHCRCQLRIEYPLVVNSWLKGSFDYYLRAQQNLIVIEAKKEDLTRGFVQLAVELIALSHFEEQDLFYGAVTIGNIWQFAKLDRLNKMIYQDLNLFKVPDDLESLIKILVGILEKP